MIETIQCPKHGERPAVPAVGDEGRVHGFTVCRTCWYPEWLRSCLRYGKRR